MNTFFSDLVQLLLSKFVPNALLEGAVHLHFNITTECPKKSIFMGFLEKAGSYFWKSFSNSKTNILVISREITPLAALYPPPIQKVKVLYRAAILSFALCGRRGRYAHAYGICSCFYCIWVKKKLCVGGWV